MQFTAGAGAESAAGAGAGAEAEAEAGAEAGAGAEAESEAGAGAGAEAGELEPAPEAEAASARRRHATAAAGSAMACGGARSARVGGAGRGSGGGGCFPRLVGRGEWTGRSVREAGGSATRQERRRGLGCLYGEAPLDPRLVPRLSFFLFLRIHSSRRPFPQKFAESSRWEQKPRVRSPPMPSPRRRRGLLRPSAQRSSSPGSSARSFFLPPFPN
jgi:hypothetical protein